MIDNFTELQAVNSMLLASGESLVNSLGSEGSTDTSVAQFVLEQVTMDFQLRGLTGGMYNITLLKNSNNEFALPEGTVEFDCQTVVYATNGLPARLVVRDGRVFNGTDGTYQFTDDSLTELDLYITRLQDWDELPLASRKAIAAQAALEYLTQVNADPIKLQMAQAKAYQTLNAHRGSDLQQRDANIFGDGGTPFRAVTRTTRTWNPRYPKF